MLSLDKKNKINSPNKLRTNLLILANDEVTRIKKTGFTNINSKNLSEFEKHYSSLNNFNFIELKQEKFVSRALTDVIQKNNCKEKFTLKSPDEMNLNFMQNKENSHFEKNNQNINSNAKRISECEKVSFLENLGISINNTKELDDFKIRNPNKKKSLISSKKNMFFKKKTLNQNPVPENENISISTKKQSNLT